MFIQNLNPLSSTLYINCRHILVSLEGSIKYNLIFILYLILSGGEGWGCRRKGWCKGGGGGGGGGAGLQYELSPSVSVMWYQRTRAPLIPQPPSGRGYMPPPPPPPRLIWGLLIRETREGGGGWERKGREKGDTGVESEDWEQGRDKREWREGGGRKERKGRGAGRREGRGGCLKAKDKVWERERV